MGFHVCAYCGKATSSGDITMRFENGKTFEVPDMIVHYVRDHQYSPDQDFVDSVMRSSLVLEASQRLQTRGLPRRIGYLFGDFPKGTVPDGFVDLLVELLEQIAKRSHMPHIRY